MMHPPQIPAMIALALALIMPCAQTAGAQDRTLTWPEVTVVAHLEADGTLRVRERQVMRFTGDWNGGERRFDVGFFQRFALEGITRLDSATGTARALTAGPLDAVDRFELLSGNTLRWRSRLPDDPPFDGRTFTYLLSFSYGRVLNVNGDGSYALAHDFAFADRANEITRFALTLTLDSVWRAPADFTGRYEAAPLAAGEGYTVLVPLTHRGAGVGVDVRRGAPNGARIALLGLVVAAAVAFVLRTVRHAVRRGQLAPLIPREQITPAFLEEHIFAARAEVIGAAWDGQTAEPEVAATLARLVQEGTLASRVETARVWVFTEQILHLELRTARRGRQGYEAALIDALFRPGEKTTDTKRVRERYKKSGFDPASVIRHGLQTQVGLLTADESVGQTTTATRTRRLITMALVVGSVLLLIAAFQSDRAGSLVALFTMGALVPVGFVGATVLAGLRQRVRGYAVALGILTVVTAVMVGVAGWFLLDNRWQLELPALGALVGWTLTLVHIASAAACTTQSAERIALRKRLAAARAWFAAELRQPQPQLVDAWYPYLLAFGLGRHVDRWFKAFGGDVASSSSLAPIHGSSSTGGGGSTASTPAAFTGFGGGGGFSGGGGGSSFGAAIGSMASSVPSPSSSGSSGGSSSSSSGGGGGGGW